jgi:hypothetical protein
LKSLRNIVTTKYLYLPWTICIMQDTQGGLLSILINNLENEQESTVIDGHDEELCD